MKKNLVAIVQARMGSSRLPGKVLMPIMEKPVLWHIVQRLKNVPPIDEVRIATSYLQRDNGIEEFCKKYDIPCFRGNDADVLDRFYKAALESCATHIIRTTGDCPLIDFTLVEQLIDYYFKNKLQYCSVATVTGEETEVYCKKHPDGMDAEIFSFSALEKAWKEADGILYREHVTPYLWKQPGKFKIGTLTTFGKDTGDVKFSMDDSQDYETIRKVYETLYPEKPGFNRHDVLNLMEKNPEIFRNKKNEYTNQM